MSARYKIDGAKLTIVLTSCGRFDLLEETVASFLKHFDTDRIVIADDAGDAGAAARFGSKFPQAEMHVNAPKLGQMRSIDALYASVQTPYVAHLEDDWKFSGGVDLDKVVRFLEARPDVSVVHRLPPRRALQTMRPQDDAGRHRLLGLGSRRASQVVFLFLQPVGGEACVVERDRPLRALQDRGGSEPVRQGEGHAHRHGDPEPCFAHRG